MRAIRADDAKSRAKHSRCPSSADGPVCVYRPLTPSRSPGFSHSSLYPAATLPRSVAFAVTRMLAAGGRPSALGHRGQSHKSLNLKSFTPFQA